MGETFEWGRSLLKTLFLNLVRPDGRPGLHFANYFARIQGSC